MGKVDRNTYFEVSKSLDKNKVVLVALNADKFPFFGESHGICAIAGYLKNTFPDVQVKIFDLQLTGFAEILNFIKLEKPAILGISAKLLTFEYFQIFLKLLNESISSGDFPLIVVGNSIPNFNAQLILENYWENLIVGTGEGEIVMGDIYRYVKGEIPIGKVRNIYYKADDEIKYSQKEYLDGADIKLPDRINTKKFYNLGAEVYIEGSRGCGYCNCTICSCKGFLGSANKDEKWRARPIELIIEDMKILENNGIENVTFADEDSFGYEKTWVYRMRNLSNSLITGDVKVNFRMCVRVNSICSKNDNIEIIEEKEEVLKLLRKAGLVKVFVGLESGAEAQLKRYRKGFNLQEFNLAYKLLKRCNIECEFGMILLDPLMNMDELKQSLRFLKTNKYVYEISSICKELRVQIGNSYVDQVKEAEKKTGLKILGKFDFNYQAYKIIRYLDEDIEFFATYIRKWVESGTKIYNVLRLFTRYSEQAPKSNEPRKFNREICFITMKKLRSTEFSLLNDFVALIEQKGKDTIAACELILRYELERRTAVSKLKATVEPYSDLVEISELYNKTIDYLKHSKQYMKDLKKNLN